MNAAPPHTEYLDQGPTSEEEIRHFNPEAEQAVLGGLLINNESFWNIEWLKAEHFYELLHQRIYTAIVDKVRNGERADGVTLKGRFENDPDMIEIGGTGYFARLAGASIMANPVPYAQDVRDLAQRRQLALTASNIYDLSDDLEITTEEMLARAEAQLAGVADESRSRERLSTVSEGVSAAIEEALVATQADKGITGVSTGIDRLDEVTAGYQDSDLIIVAARPGMGKSCLAEVMARGAALSSHREKRGVLFFSQEMSTVQFARRFLSEELFRRGIELPYTDIKKGMLRGDQVDIARGVAEDLKAMPLLIEDIGNRTVSQITSISRAADRRFRKEGHGGLGIIFIDTLQVMAGGSNKEFNRTTELTKITGGLKTLAKSMSMPVVAMSQLSRNVESRDDKRPILPDLRESGSIEQDADVVMFLYRPIYYLERNEPEETSNKYIGWLADCAAEKESLYVNFAKVREGRIQTVKLYTKIGLNVVRDTQFVANQGVMDLEGGAL